MTVPRYENKTTGEQWCFPPEVAELERAYANVVDLLDTMMHAINLPYRDLRMEAARNIIKEYKESTR
jgi:hypothetical protein